MATIVNSPQPANSNNGGGFLIGVILLIIFGIVVIFYGVPYLMSLVNTTPPSPQVNIPSNIDVNVK